MNTYVFFQCDSAEFIYSRFLYFIVVSQTGLSAAFAAICLSSGVSRLGLGNLSPASQFAYRKKHSTEDALVYAVDRWLAAKADHKTTGVVTVDMSKAFDRVQHARLLDVLLSIGIGGIALSWFSSYLSDRTQQVKVGSALSTRTHCTRVG